MRKVTYGAATSLDGYIARPDGAVDWLRWSDDVQRLSSHYWSTIDTVLMGRRTYEAARRNGGGGYPGVANFVFSRTLAADPEPHVQLVRGDAAEFVAQLKQQPGAGICVMGGGDLATALLNAGLIDEVGVNLHPLVLGDGIPFVGGVIPPTQLQLLQAEPLSADCMYLLYRVLY